MRNSTARSSQIAFRTPSTVRRVICTPVPNHEPMVEGNNLNVTIIPIDRPVNVDRVHARHMQIAVDALSFDSDDQSFQADGQLPHLGAAASPAFEQCRKMAHPVLP